MENTVNIVLSKWRDLNAKVGEKISAVSLDHESWFNDYFNEAKAKILAVGDESASFPKVS